MIVWQRRRNRRYSRNEVSGEPGAVHSVSIAAYCTVRHGVASGPGPNPAALG
jgi:hypothetical protein